MFGGWLMLILGGVLVGGILWWVYYSNPRERAHPEVDLTIDGEGAQPFVTLIRDLFIKLEHGWVSKFDGVEQIDPDTYHLTLNPGEYEESFRLKITPSGRTRIRTFDKKAQLDIVLTGTLTQKRSSLRILTVRADMKSQADTLGLLKSSLERGVAIIDAKTQIHQSS